MVPSSFLNQIQKLHLQSNAMRRMGHCNIGSMAIGWCYDQYACEHERRHVKLHAGVERRRTPRVHQNTDRRSGCGPAKAAIGSHVLRSEPTRTAHPHQKLKHHVLPKLGANTANRPTLYTTCVQPILPGQTYPTSVQPEFVCPTRICPTLACPT